MASPWSTATSGTPSCPAVGHSFPWALSPCHGTQPFPGSVPPCSGAQQPLGPPSHPAVGHSHHHDLHPVPPCATASPRLPIPPVLWGTAAPGVPWALSGSPLRSDRGHGLLSHPRYILGWPGPPRPQGSASPTVGAAGGQRGGSRGSWGLGGCQSPSAGADLAGGHRGDLGALGRAGHVGVVCHGPPAHRLHDAGAELRGHRRVTRGHRRGDSSAWGSCWSCAQPWHCPHTLRCHIAPISCPWGHGTPQPCKCPWMPLIPHMCHPQVSLVSQCPWTPLHVPVAPMSWGVPIFSVSPLPVYSPHLTVLRCPLTWTSLGVPHAWVSLSVPGPQISLETPGCPPHHQVSLGVPRPHVSAGVLVSLVSPVCS